MSAIGFRSVKDIAMYFHSSFRNVGLYVSLSFAGIAAANSYGYGDLSYYSLLIAISIIMLVISFLLNYFLFYRLIELSARFSGLHIWLLTCGIMFVLQIVMLIFGSRLLYTHFV